MQITFYVLSMTTQTECCTKTIDWFLSSVQNSASGKKMTNKRELIAFSLDIHCHDVCVQRSNNLMNQYLSKL